MGRIREECETLAFTHVFILSDAGNGLYFYRIIPNQHFDQEYKFKPIKTAYWFDATRK
jgi:hypothetical protein